MDDNKCLTLWKTRNIQFRLTTNLLQFWKEGTFMDDNKFLPVWKNNNVQF